mmetsp:Transcript_2169/g.3696  ORF Transcript_2169/g.3696 Transcript_2169/m.3696 type:complete len:303 (-) Transcript_2169:44-952(-)
MKQADLEGEGYGALHTKAKKLSRPSPVIPIAFAALMPWLVFVIVFFLFSFQMHFTSPVLCWLVVGALTVALLAAGVYGVLGVVRSLRTDTYSNAPWTIFMAGAGLIAVVCAVVVGSDNFTRNMQPYYVIEKLNTYHSVDPGQYRGNQLMDAGQLHFISGSHLDKRYGMGFISFDTYCAVPIVGAGNASLQTYDFWAVGKNCCSGGSTRDFYCGEASNPHALAGLRIINEEDKAFYRLVVQQAEAAYNIKANHPIFMYWLQDPALENSLYSAGGNRMFTLGTIAYFVAQLLLVGLAVLLLSKA